MKKLTVFIFCFSIFVSTIIIKFYKQPTQEMRFQKQKDKKLYYGSCYDANGWIECFYDGSNKTVLQVEIPYPEK